MGKYKVEVLSQEALQCGEGPHWDGKYLYYVDVPQGDVWRSDVVEKRSEKKHVDDKFVSIVIPIEGSNEFVITRDLEVLKWNCQTNKSEVIAVADTNDPLLRFNDGKCDSRGRLWVGSMFIDWEASLKQPGKGSLYCLDGTAGEKKLVKKVPGIGLSNGLTWSKDDKKMFYVDSIKRVVYVFDYDLETGNISNQRVLVDFNNNPSFSDREIPDGMTMDKSGKLWLACFRGHRVVRLDPDTGALLDQIKLPAEQITSVCFGGAQLNQLFVTSAAIQLTQDQLKAQPAAGNTFVVTSDDPNFAGLKPHHDFILK